MSGATTHAYHKPADDIWRPAKTNTKQTQRSNKHRNRLKPEQNTPDLADFFTSIFSNERIQFYYDVF